MEGLRAGDATVLRLLLRMYLGPLHRYAEALLSGRWDAEEVVQEAFVQLWEKRDRWREDGSVRALLFTLTRNLSIDTLRRRRRELDLGDQGLRRFSSPAPTPLEDTHEGELRSMAEAAVSSLPPRRQEVFRLVREAGLSYKEVAETLGISNQTVANLMSLALADLRASLKPLLEGEAPRQPGVRKRSAAQEASGYD
jgi:RNA polymerase sigma-70 factor (ECF subfamily)